MVSPSPDTAEARITFPYKRSLGPVLGAFFTALREGRIIGIRRGDGDGVLCPPLEWDPETGAALAPDFVEVGPAGTVESWCWVPEPTDQHPLSRPFAFATIRLDGASTSLLHAVDVGSSDDLRAGTRVQPRWREERRGHMTDIEAFVPLGDSGGEGMPTSGEHEGSEPVSMMEYYASITYAVPRTANVRRSEEALAERRILGLRCPTCGRVYTGGRGYGPIDALELTERDELDLPQSGTVTNFTIITPIQYPGQTETEPFARVHVLLDDTDVVLAYQPLAEVANADVRVGLRVAAAWEEGSLSTDRSASVVAWRATGEPDVTDPGLIDRIN